ncbi:MAG: hypothetical protein QMD08_00090 [Actinomycetota bacterium]|nr:hypothetical protein [Actinomycetota bacterium]
MIANWELKNWQIVLISQVVIYLCSLLAALVLYFVIAIGGMRPGFIFLTPIITAGYTLSFFLLYRWKVRDFSLASLVFCFGLLTSVPLVWSELLFRDLIGVREWMMPLRLAELRSLLIILAFLLGLSIRFALLKRWTALLISLLPLALVLFLGEPFYRVSYQDYRFIMEGLAFLCWVGLWSFLGYALGYSTLCLALDKSG